MAGKTEQYNAVIQLGAIALRTAILINGGAAIAILAFIGNVWPDSKEKILPSLVCAIWYFGLGVLCAGFTTCLAYIGEAMEWLEKDSAPTWLVFAIFILGFSAYVAFALGLNQATSAIT